MNSRDKKIKKEIEDAYIQGLTFDISHVFEELCKDLGFKEDPVHYQRQTNPEPNILYIPEKRTITMDFGKFDDPYESLLFEYLGGTVGVTQIAEPDLNFIKYQTPLVDNELVRIISKQAKESTLSEENPDKTIIMTQIYHIELADSLRAVIKHSDLASRVIGTYSDLRPKE